MIKDFQASVASPAPAPLCTVMMFVPAGGGGKWKERRNAGCMNSKAGSQNISKGVLRTNNQSKKLKVIV
jgi:hypothetical protein